jgi:1-acyl-sn-glycerol-3-phosphate acyltransferase
MLRTAAHFARLVGAGFMFVFFGVGSLALSYVLLPLGARGVVDPAERARRAHRTIARGFTLFHDVMRGLGLLAFDPRAVSLDLPDGPCVVLANHPTLVDVTATCAAIGSACTVVRSDLFDNPFIGRILRAAWHIDAGDGASMAGAAVVQGALDRLAAGLRVLIFPEGTRSPAGAIRRFRRGAFEIACRADVPLVMVFITCTPPALLKGLPWYAQPKRLIRLEVTSLGVLRPADFDRDARRLARHAQGLYRARVEAWRAAHPDDAPPAPDPEANERMDA